MKLKALIIASLVALSAYAQNDTYQVYIEQYKDVAIEQMHKYHIPASITLAQGLLESGAGTSELARKSNNHFGIKCHNWAGKRAYHDDDSDGECFRAYRTARESYEDHSVFLTSSSRYEDLFKLKETDYKGWAYGLKRAGYATSPTYAKKLIEIIERYDLARYDKMQASGAATPHTSTSVTNRYIGMHTPYLSNDLVYIVARQGDTMKAIAEEFGIPKYKLLRYNDLYKGYVPNKGDIIYLHRKRRKADKAYRQHVVGDGESMYMISQKYGVRLKRLYRMNGVTPDTYAPMVGDVIRLR
ncbi:MAG: LysM peptidoglycan-binding domain-containing protein [Bacteroidales bacterium]|nr:LysM peptidoglycan-binding domain-containing protein [Bacteroidales bacterium]